MELGYCQWETGDWCKCCGKTEWICDFVLCSCCWGCAMPSSTQPMTLKFWAAVEAVAALVGLVVVVQLIDADANGG